MSVVAFIGTGIMGREMVLKLLGAGHDVAVYNRTPQKIESLVTAGARAAASPAQAAHDADFVISMVGDDADSRRVWMGRNGIVNGNLKRGLIGIECTTLSHAWVLELNHALQSKGIRFADCPVTGGPDGAKAGALRVLAGGDSNTLNALRPMLSAFSQEVIHFGPVGAGMSYKLIVNLMGAVQASALAESLVLAEQAGLDLERVGYAMGKGAVASPHVKYLIERMVSGNHDEIYFSARWRNKDAAYALDLAAEHQLSLPTSTAGAQLFQQTVDGGLGEKNSSIVFEVLRKG